jgi:hypothetical protein
MHDITGKKIAILATDGFEQSEMMVPKRKLEDAGAEVEIVSLKPGEIWGWQHGDWGDAVPVDKTLDGVSVEDYDALVLPGGQINPDLLRGDKRAVAFVRDFYRPRSRSPRSATRLGCWWIARRDLPRALAAGGGGARQGPQDDVLSLDGDRREECRGDVGRSARCRRPGLDHEPQPGRSRCILSQDHRGGE